MYMQRSSGILCQKTPTEAEWEYAAAADVGQREYNIYKGQKKYLGQEAILVLEKTVKGDQLANFKQGNGDYGGIAGWSDDGADITNEVKNNKFLVCMIWRVTLLNGLRMYIDL
jgi:gliding motility-associated lipoprotein GldJ